jgi:hypothetical protein
MHRQERACGEQQRPVKKHLVMQLQAHSHDVRVKIAEEQHALKEEHGRVPGDGRTAEYRQRHFHEKELNAEEQGAAHADGEREKGVA